jgi:hypothetical protein
MIKLTGIQVKVGQMQDIESFPTGRLGRWKRRWLRFGKPASKIQRKGCWDRAHAEEILTEGLVVAKQIEASKKSCNFSVVPVRPDRQHRRWRSLA